MSKEHHIPEVTPGSKRWHMIVDTYAFRTFTFESQELAAQAASQAILADSHLAIYLERGSRIYRKLVEMYREGRYVTLVGTYERWYDEIANGEIPYFGITPALEAVPNPLFSLDEVLASKVA